MNALIALFLVGMLASTNARSRFRSNNPVATSTARPSLPPLSLIEKEIANSIFEIAFDISATQWDQRYSGNVVQSPASIASLLSLLLLASRGNSYSELKNALHYPPNITDTDIHQSFKKLIDSFEPSGSGVEVSTSSRLFLQEGLSINGQFNSMAKDSYKSEMRGLNFASSPVIAMNRINDWVKNASHGKITNLISRPFPTSTKFVAANVVYFNGEWENPFMDRLTSDGFFDTGKKNISIPMMNSLMKVPFLKGDLIGFDMIALPYKGGRYSMYLLTPTGRAGIQSLQRMEHVLNSYVFDELVGRMKSQRVFVKIPRMKLGTKLSLKQDLKVLGVNSIFDAKKADFGRLTTQTGIFIDDIVHEAIIEITETGTVAAAATAATFDRMGGNERFVLDRPSLLLIRDNVNKLTLFWARIVEPEPIFT